MDSIKLNDFKQKVTRYIDGRRLREAIGEIKEQAHKVMAWEVEDKVKLAEQNYQLMLQYLTQGAADPERDDVYQSLVSDLYSLLDSLVCFIESNESNTLYYSTLRYNKLPLRSNTLATMLDRYRITAQQSSIFSLVADEKAANNLKESRRQLDKIQNELFNKLWTTPQLSGDEAALLHDVFNSEVHTAQLKQHIISALTLGLLQQYDKRKIELLMSAYVNLADIKASSAALVGLLLGLWRYGNRPITRKLSDRLKAVKELPTWTSDLRIAFIELIRARDTERINQKMRDEVIPSMEKLRPNMIDKLTDGTFDPEDAASLQENPEWQDMLDKSGVADQLKELTEIQLEGGDVMMSTFSHLKMFSFFDQIGNWFLPFDSSHSSVAEIVEKYDVVGDILDQAQYLCDSDKYSFLFAIDTMPETQKNMMVGQLGAQRDTLYEMMGAKGDSTQPEERRMAVNSYIQSIYRFFKLHSRHNEFFDPFDSGINLIAVQALAEDFNDIDMLQVVAEFYFKLQYMNDALEVFNRLEQLLPGDAARYQKMGYCNEKLGNYSKAIEQYHIAELLDAESAWTLRRLASCSMALGKKEEALDYYKRLAEMQPDSMRTAMLYGQALAENDRYAEAIKQYYKVEFIDEKSNKVWRPLAWALFLTGDFNASQKYYQKIILDNPTATDYLNMGHVAMALGNMRDAVNNYALSIQAAHGDREWFVKTLTDDIPSLRKAGINLDVVPLVIDAALYALYK